MPREPVRFRNRYTGRIEEESIYGEAWLRWSYESALGRAGLWVAGLRPWFSRWYGWRMDRASSRDRVAKFIRDYHLDASEFLDAPDAFRTFNEFFYRRLRPEARPVDAAEDSVVFPADGRHLGFENLEAADSFFAKGQRFDLRSFVADEAVARRYAGGAAVFSRLCPVDYHRFHFPVSGEASEVRRVEGLLGSVNPIALRRRLAFLWENRRWIHEIRTPHHGRVLMVEIGATNVGSAVHTGIPTGGGPVRKGGEKGYFRFGGSAVMTLFEPGRVVLSADLLSARAEGLELYARVGDRMGTWRVH